VNANCKIVKVQKQLFAPGIGFGENPSRNEGCVSEPALRRADVYLATKKFLLEPLGDAVNGMTLGHC
jgi:hypothetical protein